jgi:hypothetical protein
MKKLVIMLAMFYSVLTYGQGNENIISIGISEGIGGTHLFLSPTIDFSINKSKLKFTSIPLYPRYIAIGLTQEIKTFKNKNLNWIASINYAQSKGYYWVQVMDGSWNFKNYSVISGIRLTFLKRLQLNLQLGILYQDLTSYNWVGEPSRSVRPLPYGDLSLSFEILQLYKKDKN